MRCKDIILQTVLATIRKLPNEFYTKDVSTHDDMLNAHRHLANDRSYHRCVGTRIASDIEGRWLQRVIKKRHRKYGMKWRKTGEWRSDEPIELIRDESLIPEGKGPEHKAIREGHWLSLDYMDHPMFLEVKALFERYPEIGGVHFRPTERGITVLDLHPESPKPRIGVGEDPYLLPGTRAREIVPTMRERIAHLERVRQRQKKRSQENQLEAYLIRHAQANQLELVGFPERLRFVHSQWRISQPGVRGQQFTDLLAVDLISDQLVLIELKTQPDPAAFGQVLSYLGYFQEHAEILNPFFSRLARIMGKLYECAELEELDELGPATVGLVAWPEKGQIAVQNLADLDKIVPDSGTKKGVSN